MRNFFSFLLFIAVTFGVFCHTAEAARFGGGRSFGVSRSVSSFSRSAPSSFASATRPAASKWGGPLAGLFAGGLLAYLFMGHGIGSGLVTWLVISSLSMMLLSFLRNRLQSTPSYSQSHISAFTGNTQTSTASITPIGFDAAAFLRNAKVQFIRLQAAYDSKNLADIREFCSPEVFGEIQLQLQERGDALNQTEVVSLNALLLETTTEAQGMVASVAFSGLIKENGDTEKSFSEIWHFSKDISKNNWIVTGVEQN